MEDSLQVWDSCVSAIVYGGNPEQAQERFEAWCHPPQEGEHPAMVTIKKIVAGQFVDQLLTEAGGQPLDWKEMWQRICGVMEATPANDDYEEGYWVDISQVMPPGKISADIESLQRELPEDIRSGLNWSPDKKFLYCVSVLTASPVTVLPGDNLEADTANLDDQSEAGETPDLDGFVSALPDMREKEATALVEARNSVVAAWLWRKYAADTRLAANEIHVANPCIPFIPVE